MRRGGVCHLVSDVVVGELQDVSCQVAHGVQRHRAVLEQVPAAHIYVVSLA